MKKLVAAIKFAPLLGLAVLQAVVGPVNPAPVQANESFSAQQALGGAGFQNWTGLKPVADGAAEWNVSAPAVYRVPDGSKGWYNIGLTRANDSTIDARQWHGLRFDVRLERDDAPMTADLTIQIPAGQSRHDLLESASARAQTQGKGWHTITVPFASFDYNRGQVYFLKFLNQITFKGRYDGAANSAGEDHVLLRNVRLVRGDVLHLDAAIRSAPAEAGGSVTYPVTVLNCSDAPQNISLTLRCTGWEGMAAEVSPAMLLLQPGQSGNAIVRVTVPVGIPPGAQEKQTLLAAPLDGSAPPETMAFITLRRLPFPYLVHDAKGWDEVRAKVARYDWARQQADKLIRRADDFEVPTVPPGGISSDQGTPAVFKSYIEGQLWSCAVAWKLTGKKSMRKKSRCFCGACPIRKMVIPKRCTRTARASRRKAVFLKAAPTVTTRSRTPAC